MRCNGPSGPWRGWTDRWHVGARSQQSQESDGNLMSAEGLPPRDRGRGAVTGVDLITIRQSLYRACYGCSLAKTEVEREGRKQKSVLTP